MHYSLNVEQFPPSSEPVDYALAALEDRSAPRIKISIPASFRKSGDNGFKVNVVDLSLSGFAAEAPTGIPVGSRCWLTMPGLAPLEAEMIRNDGFVIGCAFTNLLNQSVLNAIVQRYQLVEESV